MAFFNKTDPAEKHQRDLEAKLTAARASRDDLVARRNVAETAAATHREKACKLAAEGADDKTLSAAENAMRREQDRVATLSDALMKTESTIADLEREIAQVVDQRCRAETAAAVNALVEKWGTVRSAFNAVINEIVDLARESAAITLDAHPLKVFVEAVQAQVPPETEFVASVLQGHAKAVLNGAAPASLPKPPEPAPVVVVEQPPQTRTVFATHSLKWTENGRQRTALAFEDVTLPLELAEKALRIGACVPQSHDMRKTHKGARGGYQPDPDAIGVVDLDAVTEYSGARHQNFDPVAQANITVIDRGVPERKGTIAVHRV